MTTNLRRLSATCLIVLALSAPALADITVAFEPQNAVITSLGGTTDVQLWANFDDSIVGWGLDLDLDMPTVADWAIAALGPAWNETSTLDGDGLAGLAFPPGQTGDVLLATLTFTGMEIGTTDLTLGYDGEDEGFLLELGGLDELVNYGSGSITVTPEPATIVLLALSALALRRRGLAL